ncbi:hypothetical protein XU18_1515 [Perkinsela sp. CCAP 1560/4]|nr:hypothetical protein XU18_1515 [Perkinsela sp. CCAP 1560/4]|eukprot:KNH07883.1 hypothetical protein XU18_1515 [Perkinsela sp. CCAP 1560/4]
MLAVVLFTASDDGVSKFDPSTLPLQTLMELFIFGFDEPEKLCGSRENPDELCQWQNVTCNADEEVNKFVCTCQGLRGTLGFKFLPSTMGTLGMPINALTGTIKFADLRGNMEFISLHTNQLTGSLDLDCLPATMRGLSLHKNKFTGQVSLEHLPEGLQSLSVSTNQLSANPTKGHLSVVGWTSTPVLGEAKNLFKPLVVFLSWRRPY